MNKTMDPHFEAWARKMSMDLEYRNIPGVGKFYECPRTLLAFEAWQASRAAIEVELPEPYAVIGDYAACGGGRSVLDVEYAEKITDRMCKKTPVYDRAQLEAAGLKVKP